MGSLVLLQSLKENILGQAGVKTIYSESIASWVVVFYRQVSIGPWLKTGTL